MDLSRISLRRNERGLLVGGTNTGKSTLAEALVVDFLHRYQRDNARVLILDSKPRFRAEYLPSGRPAKRLYKKWDHGPTVPGSVRVTDPAELRLAFATENPIVIAQAETNRDIPALVACAEAFFGDSRRGQPRLLDVDETMDFFSANGAPRGTTDALTRASRAGRERGLAALYCSQRTRQIPATLMEELAKLYLFRLDYRADAKRLLEMGAPEDIVSRMPMEKHRFVYWTKDDYPRVWGPYALDLRR